MIPESANIKNAIAPILAAALMGLLVFAGKALLIDHLQTPILRARFADGIEAGLQTPIQARFGGQITLLGYDLPDPEVASGGEARLRLYWQADVEDVPEDFSSIVTLHDSEGNAILTTGSQHPGGWPTSRWSPGDYAQERLTIVLPPGTPPGEYLIRVGLYSHSAGRNLDVYDAAGNALGVTVDAGVLTITRPRHPAAIADLEIAAPLAANLADDLVLLGVDLPPASREVGQPLPVVWHWQAAGRPGEALTARLVWLTESGEVAAASAAVAPAAGYPTDQWEPGDVWRGVYTLHIPGRLEAGDYDVAVQLADPAGDPVGNRVVVGEMAVTTPPRLYEPPPMGAAADIAWENGIRLIGYDLPAAPVAPGDSLTLTLYWQPRYEVAADLKVFVHLVDAAGNLVAQCDQIPLSGARPTPGWAPGEIITDSYTLPIGETVPPGEYTLRIGWYDPATWARVRLPGGGDFGALPETITVAESAEGQ